jgi:16S rRNA processing protein RimM
VSTEHRSTEDQIRGSGGQGRSPEPRFLAIGPVVGAHGLRGELKVAILTDDPQRFGLLDRVFVGQEDESPVARAIEGFRLHKGRALLRLEGCTDRTAAEALRGYLVQIPSEESLPLEEGEYYEHQILGLEVWTASGEYLGELVEIIYTGANDVYVVEPSDANGKDILVPALEDVVLDVDLDAGRLVVELPVGLL